MKITIEVVGSTFRVEIDNEEIEFQTKAGEDAAATTGTASNDPVSRANENRDRQQGSIVGTTDGRQHGGVEELAAAVRHAPIQPEKANEAPKQVYGDSEDWAMALPSESVDIPAGGGTSLEIDGSTDACPAETHSPVTATKQRVNVHSQHEANPPGQATVQNECVTVVGTERGTVANSEPYVLRPNCQRPDFCGGYGDRHCHSCTILMASAEDTRRKIAAAFKGEAA